MPRWVRVLVVLGILLLVAFAVGMFAGSAHGPGRHGGEDDPPTSHSPVYQEP